MRTYCKREIAQVLRAIADWIETCQNKSVTVHLEVTFNTDKEAEG